MRQIYRMRTFKLCIIMMVLYVFARCDAKAVGISPTSQALKVGEGITKTLDGGKFLSVITNIAGKAGPYLNGVVSVVKLILGFLIGEEESAEMKYLRQLSKEINTRFDDVDAQLSDIKKFIQWSAIQAPYLNIALKIRAISTVYGELFTVPMSVIETEKMLFIKSYESGYQESGTKLFMGFVQDLGPFGGNLLDSAMRFYENDRPKMRSLMIALTKLLFMASQLELGYYAAKGISDLLIDIRRQQWEDRFRQISQRMSMIDQEVESKWKEQYLLDIDRFLLDNRRMNNSNLSESLYNKMSTKYFWRDWLVIVSDHMKNHQYDRQQVCGGYAHTKYDKDVVVTSVPLNKTTVDEDQVLGMTKSLGKTLKAKRYGNADLVFSWINPAVRNECTHYGGVGIMYSNKGAAFTARMRNDTSIQERECINFRCTYTDIGYYFTADSWVEFERLYIYLLGTCKSYHAYFFG